MAAHSKRASSLRSLPQLLLNFQFNIAANSQAFSNDLNFEFNKKLQATLQFKFFTFNFVSSSLSPVTDTELMLSSRAFIGLGLSSSNVFVKLKISSKLKIKNFEIEFKFEFSTFVSQVQIREKRSSSASLQQCFLRISLLFP